MFPKWLADAFFRKEITSTLYWFFIGCTILFLCWAPFQFALYNGSSFLYEKPLYFAVFISSLILLNLSFYLIPRFRMRDIRDLMSILLILLSFSSVITWLTAVSYHNAVQQVFVQFILMTFFMIGAYVAGNSIGRWIFTVFIWGTGIFIVFLGLMNWLGYGIALGHLLSFFSSSIENGKLINVAIETDHRLVLGAIFQNAHAYAGFLIALLFSTLHFSIHTFFRKLNYVSVLTLVPIWSSLLLTASPSILFSIPIAFVIISFFYTLKKQIDFSLTLIITLLIAASIHPYLYATGLHVFQGNPKWSDDISLFIILATSALALWVTKYMRNSIIHQIEADIESVWNPRISRLIWPIIYISLGTLLAAIFAQDFLKNVWNSSIRAFDIIQAYPLFGAGGGTWQLFYQWNQHDASVVDLSHSSFAQVLLESGGLGLVMLISFIGFILFIFIKKEFHSLHKHDMSLFYFILVICLLINSLFTATLNYVYIQVLFYLSLGAMVSTSGKLPFQFKKKITNYKKIVPFTLIFVSVVSMVMATRFLIANHYFYLHLTTANDHSNPSNAVTYIEKALTWNPSHPEYVAAYNEIYLKEARKQNSLSESDMQKIQQQLTSIARYEKFDRKLMMQQIELYQFNDSHKLAEEFQSNVLTTYPWDIQLYALRMNDLADKGGTYFLNQNQVLFEQTSIQITQLHNEFKSHVNRYPNQLFDYTLDLQVDTNTVNPRQTLALSDRNIDLKHMLQIDLALAKILYMQGKYQETTDLLKPHMMRFLRETPDLISIRWYLAALARQNLTDDKINDIMLSYDPTEEEKINELLSYQPLNGLITK
jgi:hypothetical protein